ncbi:MAG TPA: hypothetical protein VLI04_14845 [Nocardioidaceae bacterium]|nr:hypothetical protein [Nocardioidaceae bacterium]
MRGGSYAVMLENGIVQHLEPHGRVPRETLCNRPTATMTELSSGSDEFEVCRTCRDRTVLAAIPYRAD